MPHLAAAVAVFVLAGMAAVAEKAALAFHRQTTADSWIASQVMEERERDRYFKFEWNFDYDNRVMVERAEATRTTTPPFADRSFLPPFEVAINNRNTCSRYLRWLEWIRPWRTVQEKSRIDTIADEVTRRQAVWTLIGDIQGNYLADGARLNLGKLRELVGKDVYESKVWPTPIPEWLDQDEYEEPPEREVEP